MEHDEPIQTNDMLRAVELLLDQFAEKRIRYALIGGLAVILRGRPRFTQDVDVLLEVPQLVLPSLLDNLSEAGYSLDVKKVMQEFEQHQVTAFSYRGVRIDWLKPVLPLYARVLNDATDVSLAAGRTIRVATAEGLILTKLIAFRPRDKDDMESLFLANRETLNVDYLRHEWAPLSEGEIERNRWLEDAVHRLVPSKSP